MAAEEIKAILAGRDKAEQERITRWVAESLGFASTSGHPTSAVTHIGAPVAPAPAQPVSTLGAPAKSKDIRTFVSEKNPRSDIQFAAVTAYYHRFEAPQANRRDTITATDLQESSRQARGYGFKKPIATLSNALKQGYFDRAGRGEFSLNAVGENLVAMTLPSTSAGATGKPKTRPKNKRATTRRRKSKAS